MTLATDYLHRLVCLHSSLMPIACFHSAYLQLGPSIVVFEGVRYFCGENVLVILEILVQF